MVSAGNGALHRHRAPEHRHQLKGLRAQLLALANQDDGAGTYLFAGQGATQKPFVDAPGGVQYAPPRARRSPSTRPGCR